VRTSMGARYSWQISKASVKEESYCHSDMLLSIPNKRVSNRRAPMMVHLHCDLAHEPPNVERSTGENLALTL
jgi:hypothetical protein